MDRLLCFKKSHSKTKVELEDAVADTIKKEYSDVFKEMRKSKSSSATWEMKSLSAGPIEAMTSVIGHIAFLLKQNDIRKQRTGSKC